jgi:hypothetical protein
MPKSGRLVLTKAVLSTIPTYTLMAEQLPLWAIEEIDKFPESSSGKATTTRCAANALLHGALFAARQHTADWE